MTRQERRSRLLDFQKIRRSLREPPARGHRPSMKQMLIALLAVVFLVGGYRVLAADKTPDQLRADAQKAQKAGNFKDAYEGYTKLLADPNDDKTLVSRIWSTRCNV